MEIAINTQELNEGKLSDNSKLRERPWISFVLPTYRPGGMDLLAISEVWKAPGYELVVVDGYPGRVERCKALQYLLDRGINVGWYGPPKPKCYPETPVNFANAMNTGILHSRGHYIVFVHDFMTIPSNALKVWMESFSDNGRKAIISGMAYVYNFDPPEIEDDITVWKACEDPRTRLISRTLDWIPQKWEIFYCGFHVSYFDEVNGFDERGDGCISWPLESVVAQSNMHDYRLVVDRRLEIYMCNHRKWEGEEHLWNTGSLGILEPDKRDELEPGWLRRSPNPFDFRKEHLKYLEERGCL